MRFHCYFKLFNSIKDEHEAKDLARMELEALFGDIKGIGNFAVAAQKKPLKSALEAVFRSRNGGEVRLADALTYELPYGKVQGYYGRSNEVPNFHKLTRRLAYTKEFFVIVEGKDGKFKPGSIFPKEGKGFNWQVAKHDGLQILRLITNQYILEKSEYISKLSRNEKEVRDNLRTLLEYPSAGFYRVPATETMRIGRRLEDWFAIRAEPSLYLTHYMHPYKGKFHPKMARALLNYVYPSDDGVALDNFAGSGTLLVEAVLMGLDARGVEINPLSTLMSNVKCQSLKIPPKNLARTIKSYLKDLKDAFSQVGMAGKGQRFLDEKMDFGKIEKELKSLPKRVKNGFKGKQETITQIAVAYRLLEKKRKGPQKDFLLLALSGAVSDSFRRTAADFYDVLSSRLKDLYLRHFLFHELNRTLRIELGDSECFTEDTRDMKSISDESVDAIVNSPPYSTALDYIRNDEPQLVLLGLAGNIADLENHMIGNPKHNPSLEAMLANLDEQENKLPTYAVKKAQSLADGGRRDAALRCLKFFLDINATLKEMHRVLRPGAKAAIVIGNNHFKVQGKFEEIKNIGTVLQMGRMVGFEKDALVERELEKSSSGMIRKEAVILLTKPA
jgi:DNA modification methylase